MPPSSGTMVLFAKASDNSPLNRHRFGGRSCRVAAVQASDRSERALTEQTAFRGIPFATLQNGDDVRLSRPALGTEASLGGQVHRYS
jgi:hypothetical protein